MADLKLSLRGVHRHYLERDARLDILVNVALDIAAGEIVALVAPSGAGKSTLLHVCGLLERPQQGEITICGTSAHELNDRARTLLRRQNVGYIYQFHHLLPEFSARENIMMPLLIAGVERGAAQERADALLNHMVIKERGDHRPAQLSGGEQQRVAIGRAMANNPGLILADEPTGNLDPETSGHVFDLLANSIKDHQAAGLIATHNHDIARRADRVVTLNGGAVVPTKLA
ncbi:ABC transporter ATP-binding protein [Maritalea mediterranea]|uniref:ABC transporter ATP-binding protein n=1 Tax=Maritalea mediterranea TaxID=2909667 RepID=A0ABS9EAU9_9HYPH|nr:ABC transporter ATP-binding protein [Maritalea mediterranea]MCF4098566.1 ABC transporter ATP-binding protein [Maritalea mediterranea]